MTFSPFSANKGGSINGTKLFLTTFDLAFALQEQLKKFENGGNSPAGFRPGLPYRARNLTLLRRLLRQGPFRRRGSSAACPHAAG
jgi:hypothetical protein